jgi:phosphate-selective porin
MALNNFIKAACLSTCLGLASGSVLANTNVETNGGLSVYDSENSDHWFKLNGKMQMDLDLNHEGLKKFGTTFDLRSVQATVKGGMGQDLSYSFRLKRGRGETKAVSMDQARVAYSGFNSFSKLTVGQVDLPYGLSSNLTESSIANHVFSPSSSDGSLGLSLTCWNDHFGATYALKQHDKKEVNHVGSLDSAARVSFSPFNRDNLVVHLGASAHFVQNEKAKTYNDASVVSNNGKGAQRGFGLDTALLRGPLFLQAQAHQVSYLGKDADKSVMGWTVEGSYALTGESRDYDRIKGSFGSLKSTGDSSWQLTVRSSGLQQHDGDFHQMLGANVAWTFNNNLTLFANYENALKDNKGALSLRLQAAW